MSKDFDVAAHVLAEGLHREVFSLEASLPPCLTDLPFSYDTLSTVQKLALVSLAERLLHPIFERTARVHAVSVSDGMGFVDR